MKKISRYFTFVFVALTASVLVACGGGGGVAGDSADFAVFPDSANIKAGLGDLNCVGVTGIRTTFTIVGGKPPFRLVNSYPQYLRLDRTEATGQDPTFVVTPLGGCGESLTILVLDLHSRSTTIAFTVEEGDEITE